MNPNTESRNPSTIFEHELKSFLDSSDAAALRLLGATNEILVGVFQTAFQAGAVAVEAAIESSPFDGHVLLREKEGPRAGHAVAVRAVQLDSRVYFNAPVDLHTSEAFDSSDLSEDTRAEALALVQDHTEWLNGTRQADASPHNRALRLRSVKRKLLEEDAAGPEAE